MKVLFVAAEATPFVKVGGLADVIGSLPKALVEIGHDVRVIMPGYGVIDSAKFPTSPVIDNLNVMVMGTIERVSLKVAELGGNVKVYLVDSNDFRNSVEVYGKGELNRFLLFCRAVLDMLSELDWKPEIVHCHDWHTAFIPRWLKKDDFNCASIFTIHNLAYQGFFDSEFLTDAQLENDWHLHPHDAPEPPLNFMSQGILWADLVTTVSETYAKEILTPEYGAGLDYLLRYREDRLFGIVNGLDYEEFNPATDVFIPTAYDFHTLGRRVKNKLALQKRAGFAEDVAVPLIGMVSRLDEQKGLDILTASFDSLFQNLGSQVVILGKGREEYHDLLRQAAGKYPERLAVFIDFDDALARLIYAGCDMFLMPSRFEPCGLGQLIAMRYGAIPIVRHTGGLADTVQDLTPDLNKGSGFVFQDYDSEAMLATIERAINSYGKKAWQDVMQRIMGLNFSWKASARKYESLYRKALKLKNL
jgi:starch synthase